jgi:hypothetical protein
MTWVTVKEYLCYKWPRISLICRNYNSVLSSFMTYHWFCNTMGATRGAETAYSSRTNEFTSDLSFYCLLSVLWILVCLFVHLAVVCLSIYGILITPSECNLDYCCYSIICNMCYHIFIKATKICMNVCPIHYKPYGTSKWIYHNVLTSQ